MSRSISNDYYDCYDARVKLFDLFLVFRPLFTQTPFLVDISPALRPLRPFYLRLSCPFDELLEGSSYWFSPDVLLMNFLMITHCVTPQTYFADFLTHSAIFSTILHSDVVLSFHQQSSASVRGH